MDLFTLKKISDKLFLKFDDISIFIHSNEIRIIASDDVVEEIIKSKYLSDEEKSCITYDIELEKLDSWLP